MSAKIPRPMVVTVSLLMSIVVSSAYASSQTVSATGRLGAGGASVQSSCVGGVVSLVPLDSTKAWSTTENFWVYPDLVVSGDFHACHVNDKVAIAIYVPGSAPTTIAAEYALKSADISTSASFTVTLATALGKAYLPATASGNSYYGILVHS